MRIKRFLQILITSLVISLTIVQAEETEPSWWDKTRTTLEDTWGQSVKKMGALVGDADSQNVEKNPHFVKVWEGILPKIEELLALEHENESLPDSAWFAKDKQDNQQTINELLEEAINILGISETTDLRQQIKTLRQAIREAEETITKYRQAKVSAPLESPWKTTVADYEEKIADLQEDIAQYEQEIAQKKQAFAASLAKVGVQMTPEQVELLLASVVGDDIVQSSVVYNNVREISQQLMNLTIESDEDIAISKRYYGMYTVLLKMLLYMQKTFIDNIDNKYLPKIEQIVTEVQEINAMTQQLLREEQPENQRKHLMANLEAQGLTLQTAALYKQHLSGQRSKMAIARDKTKADLRIAQNTYRTVKISGELVNLLRASQKSFEVLLNIQVPELLVFENLQMKQEFATLTSKLNQAD